MKAPAEIERIMTAPMKEVEKELGIKIRNGQAMQGVRKALSWVQR